MQRDGALTARRVRCGASQHRRRYLLNVIPPAEPRAATLYELLAAQARRSSAAPALLMPGRSTLTFGGLIEQIDSVGAVLNQRGLGRTDRVALLAGRGPETAAAALGIACFATCAPLNASAPLAETELGLTRVKARALVVPGPARPDLREMTTRLGIALLECSIQPTDPAGRFTLHGGEATAAARPGLAAPDEIALVLSTSGTTARSKLVPISHSNICARTDKSRRMFELGPTDRCLNLMPLCYNHGLNTGLMTPLAAGGSVILPPAFDIDSFLECLRTCEPTYYTASFTYHRTIVAALEQRPHDAVRGRLRFARSGSGPLPGDVRIGTERLFGVPLLESYGATETGVIIANRASGPNRPGTVGVPIDDDIAIMDDDGALAPTGQTGEVLVRGPAVFSGYEHDPSINETLFVDGWFRTGDHGTRDADGFITLLGRIDEVINRGGEKIAPREIDDALLEHPAVLEAMCFAVPHPSLHHDVAAAVVLRPDAAGIRDIDLRRFLAGRLVPSKLPRSVVFAKELPKGPTGKPRRKELAEHFGPKLRAETGHSTQSATAIQEILLKLWREVLKRDEIGCDDNFFLCGGDSLQALRLLAMIEQTLQYRVPLTALFESPTVKTIERYLTTSTRGAIDDTIRIRAAGTQRPLFAVGGRQGHAIRFFPALAALGEDQPSFALQPPGMDWGSAGCETISQMAAHYVGRIKALQPQGPYRLLGVSFGGIVIYEIALQLQAAGERVDFLGIVDTPPMTCVSEDITSISKSTLMVRGTYDHLADYEHSLEAVNHRVSAAHVNARNAYIVDTRSKENLFGGEMIYFYASGEPVTPHDRRSLWQRLAPGGFKLVRLPGRHGLIHREPQREKLTALLQTVLAGGKVPTVDPASVFEQSYRLERSTEGEIILGSTGERYAVGDAPAQGEVVLIQAAHRSLVVRGWAAEPDRSKPAETIAVFQGTRCLGYGSTGAETPRVPRRLRTPALHYAGFTFTFRGESEATEPLRVFVLSAGGGAFELPLRRDPVETIDGKAYPHTAAIPEMASQ